MGVSLDDKGNCVWGVLNGCLHCVTVSVMVLVTVTGLYWINMFFIAAKSSRAYGQLQIKATINQNLKDQPGAHCIVDLTPIY